MHSSSKKGREKGGEVISDEFIAAVARRKAELDDLPHIDEAIRQRNAFLDTQPPYCVSVRKEQ